MKNQFFIHSSFFAGYAKCYFAHLLLFFCLYEAHTYRSQSLDNEKFQVKQKIISLFSEIQTVAIHHAHIYKNSPKHYETCVHCWTYITCSPMCQKTWGEGCIVWGVRHLWKPTSIPPILLIFGGGGQLIHQRKTYIYNSPIAIIFKSHHPKIKGSW